jgi:hypothetical protein
MQARFVNDLKMICLCHESSEHWCFTVIYPSYVDKFESCMSVAVIVRYKRTVEQLCCQKALYADINECY